MVKKMKTRRCVAYENCPVIIMNYFNGDVDFREAGLPYALNFENLLPYTKDVVKWTTNVGVPHKNDIYLGDLVREFYSDNEIVLSGNTKSIEYIDFNIFRKRFYLGPDLNISHKEDGPAVTDYYVR